MTRQSRFHRPKASSSPHPSYRLHRTVDDPKLDIPPVDENSRYWYFTHRIQDDQQYVNTQYDEVGQINNTKRILKPAFEVVSREPSFTDFKVPFQMICQERYTSSVKLYDEQFCREINKIIDNQPTAREATYFVRIVSYTTLWPPYHNERELTDTCRKFYALTPKERDRFQNIMAQDY